MADCSKQEFERQISWRRKQVEIGRASVAYSRYRDCIPVGLRSREHPWTPDPYDARMSKRQFEGRIKAWKRSIYELYPDQDPETREQKPTPFAVNYFFANVGEYKFIRNFRDLQANLVLDSNLGTDDRHSTCAEDAWVDETTIGRDAFHIWAIGRRDHLTM